eukprot:147041_1
MEALRRKGARQQVLGKHHNKKKSSYSSLSSLPSTTYQSNRYQSKKSNSIKKTRPNHQIKERNYTEQKDEESNNNEDYDSTDSLDQLLNNDYIPEKSKPDHMKITNSLNRTPRKHANIAGGKRAKALALMATTSKKSKKRNGSLRDTRREIHNSNKKEYKSICNKLKKIDYETTNSDTFITPFVKSRHDSNFSALRRSR